jgi:hypothetical protein
MSGDNLPERVEVALSAVRPAEDTFTSAGPLAQARHEALPLQAAAALRGAVALTRVPDYFAQFASIHLLIDEEQEVGAVYYGCRRVFDLPPGVYSLSVEMDWCRSRPRTVEIRPGELIELEASLRWRGLLWWLSLFAIFIFPGRVFVIRPVHRPEARVVRHDLWEGIGAVAGFGFLFCLVLSLLVLFALLLG